MTSIRRVRELPKQAELQTINFAEEYFLRRLSFLDRILREINSGLDSVCVSSPSPSNRSNPSKKIQSEDSLSLKEKKHVSGLMRVDHSGEICAQALYRGQAFLAKKPETQAALLQAAMEEQDHLTWCQERLNELASRPSYLNGFWYTASFFIGLLVSACGDEWSNGFVVETEHQVERHLEAHLAQLPIQDERSRAILEQMKQEEMEHAALAKERGSNALPFFIKALMFLQSQALTRTAYWV